MTVQDICGQRITVPTAAAADAWGRTLHGFVAHGSDTPDHLATTLELAPDFALGWAAKGFFYVLLGRAELIGPAREALATAEDAATKVGATVRERRYLDALRHAVNGRLGAAANDLSLIASDHPGDVLAMKIDHALRFILGDREGMLRQIGFAMDWLDESHPLFGYALGCKAFALEENGFFAAAEVSGRRALEHAPDDAWALHAVAHVYDMTGQTRTGIDWLSRHEQSWVHCNNFGYHMWWHLALFHLDRGDYDRVLDLYDSRVRAEHTDDYRDIANGASMLVRLELEGVDVGTRWEELAELSARRVEPGCVVFADLHYLLSLQGAKRDREAERMITRLAADARRSDHDMHEVAGLAGLPCALGLAAFRAGNYALAFDRLREAGRSMQRLGGSHAQRDVFSRITIEAAIRAKRFDEAETELAARASRRGAEDGFTARRRAAISRLRARALAAE